MNLGRTVKVIRAASASTEARFVDIGERLESSIETLSRVTATFQTLSSELASDDLRLATRNLSQISSRITALTTGHSSAVSLFAQLIVLTTAIEGRIIRMVKSVNGVSMLATNAKIAAAHIGDASVEFRRFADDISRTLQLAKASLTQFSAEFSGLGSLLQAAMATQSKIEEQQVAAGQAIPRRLDQSVDAIAARAERAVATATAVGEGSQRIGKRISDAVMALQIGDVTRQRLEHVDYALGLLDETMAPLTQAQQEALSEACYRLQSAQLTDTADRLEQETQQLVGSLQDLALDARAVLHLGQDAFGAGEASQGTFLDGIASEVGAVGALLTGFHAARQEASRVAASVAEATGQLVSHISAVQELESDIRLMGLNITFKGGRLGAAGLPLSIIAQELRVYSKEIAADAASVATDLDRVTELVLCLSDQAQDGKTADAASISAIMADSVARLGAAGQSLAGALGSLQHDGHVVAALLQDTLSRTNVHDDIGRTLRRAAAELPGAALNSPYDLTEGPAEGRRFFELLMDSYTMEVERTVLMHNAPTGLPERQVVLAPASGAAELDDIFF